MVEAGQADGGGAEIMLLRYVAELDDLHAHGALWEAEADAPVAGPVPTDRTFSTADLFVGIGAIDRHVRPALRTHDEGRLNAASCGRQSVNVLARVRVLRHVLKK